MKLKILLLAVLLLFPLCYIIKPSFAYTGTITYSAATDTITAIGGNTSNPIAFRDLYDADLAGGWNQITLQSVNQYSISCKIVLGNGTREGTTIFTDSNKHIVFPNNTCTGNNQILINVTNYVTLTLGVLVDATTKRTSSGVSFLSSESVYDLLRIIYGNEGCTINLYDCTFQATTIRACINRYLNRVWNCHFTKLTYIEQTYGTIDIYNIYVTGAEYGLVNPSSGLTLSDSIFNTEKVAYIDTTSTNYTLTNVKGYISIRVFNLAAGNNNVNCVDFNINSWTFGSWGTFTGEVYRKYTFDIYVLNGNLTDYVENANVSLSQGGTVFGSWLTNSSGQIATQTLTYGYYNVTGGNTMYGGTAWKLTITHDDWATYESYFYPYSAIDWSISMQSTSTVDNNMLLAFLFMGCLCFTGIIIIKRRSD